jgi:hypothetical protein
LPERLISLRKTPKCSCNVANWESPQAWEAATANAEFQDGLRALAHDAEVQFCANPALYEIVVAYGDHEQA